MFYSSILFRRVKEVNEKKKKRIILSLQILQISVSFEIFEEIWKGRQEKLKKIHFPSRVE